MPSIDKYELEVLGAYEKGKLKAGSGSTDLHALVMFVVDASRPFSSPRTIP